MRSDPKKVYNLASGAFGSMTLSSSLASVNTLTAIALARKTDLSDFSGRVSDSGEGRWTVTAAVDEGAPVPVLSAALFQRFNSRGEADFADKLLSAMRFEFGGHREIKPSPEATMVGKH